MESIESEGKCKVMFVDDDPQVGVDWKEILEPRGYEVIVAQGEGQSLIEDARALAREERPHVIIVDLRLKSEEPNNLQGLELLEEFPVPYILYSAYLDDAELLRRVNDEHEKFIWVKKTGSPRQLLEDIERLTGPNCQARRKLNIQRLREFRSEMIVKTLFPQEETVPPRLVDDLLCQLFPNTNQLELIHIDNQVRTPATPRTVSRGRSIVLRVQPNTMESVVVKLAAAEHIDREYKNHKRYVDGKLGGSFYPQLRRAGRFWELGASCYTFFSSAEGSRQLFSAFYHTENESDRLLRPIEYFCQNVWPYYRENASLLQVPLFVEYDQKLQLEQRLRKLDTRHEQRSFAAIPHALPNPVRWVLSHKEQCVLPNVKATVVHGDLHGDNLFVDGEHAWPIDFERTGPSHKLRDFAELEVDILTRLLVVTQADLLSFYHLALTVAHHPQADHYNSAQLERRFPLLSRWQPSAKMQKALGIIAGIRRLAHSLYNYATPEEYLWAVLLTALFTATLHPRGDLQREQALLLASVICQRLRTGARNWPPVDWLQLEQGGIT
ncbi:MAG: phosphotransferase [Chloroflexota bacterium]